MYQEIQVTVHKKSGQRKLFNALLALATGALALIWPNFLYYIVGGYLVALSLILLYFKVSNFLTALSLLTAVLIFLLPELIPYTFAFFLGVFGLTFLMMQLLFFFFICPAHRDESRLGSLPDRSLLTDVRIYSSGKPDTGKQRTKIGAINHLIIPLLLPANRGHPFRMVPN